MSRSPSTKISIIILTANRNFLLRRCLRSLITACDAAPDNVSFETIVLINGESKETHELATTELRGRDHVILKHSSQMLPGWARNLAINQATGDWLFFADDDIFVEADFFTHFQMLADRRPDYSAFGGPNLTPPQSTRFQRLSGAALSSYIGSFHCSRRYRLTAEILDADESALTLCNLFIRGSSLGSLRFSKNLVCAEENNLLAELARKGLHFVAHPDLNVYHERRTCYADFVKQIFKYGRGRAQLLLSGQAKWFHLIPLISVTLTIVSAFFHLLFSISLTLMIFYVSLLVFASIIEIFTEKLRLFDLPIVLMLIFSLHVSYAFGMGYGIALELTQKIEQRLQMSRLY